METRIDPALTQLLKHARSDHQSIADDPALVGRLCAASSDGAWKEKCLAFLDYYFEIERTPREAVNLFFSGPSEIAFNKDEDYIIFFQSVRDALRAWLKN